MTTVVSPEEHMLLRDDTNQQCVYIYKFKKTAIYIASGIEKLIYTLIISTEYKIELFNTENKCTFKLNIQDILEHIQTTNSFKG
jgi:hypothetical protein